MNDVAVRTTRGLRAPVALLRRTALPAALLLLAWALWTSEDFKQIAAGVAIFLFGVLGMEEGFKTFTGGALDRILRRTTSGPWRSLGFGILSTSVMQSSSLVSVIAISFLSAGLITLQAGIGIIFGANLGTTTGAWLIAGFGLKVKISAYAMPMLVLGVVLVLQRSRTARGIGYVLTGLGFLFLGIDFMKSGFDAFREDIDLARFAIGGYPGVLLFTGLGIAATVIMQSSHATLVLTITALASGQLEYENALALAIGANVGTTITALIGSMGANAEGKRLAMAHLVFNVTTGLIAIVFIHQFMAAVEWASDAVGIAQDDHTLKLAVFHTLFNLVGVALMMPLVGTLVRTLERTVRGPRIRRAEPVHLTSVAAVLPDAALEAARLETLHLLSQALDLITRALGFPPPPGQPRQRASDRIRPEDVDVDAEYERNVKPLYGAIVEFLSKARVDADADSVASFFGVRSACRSAVEAVKATKHLHKNLAPGVTSTNESIRERYDALRARLSQVVEEIRLVVAEGRDPVTILSLDDAKLVLLEGDAELNVELEHLIRTGSITPDAATSLMNDSRYVYQVGMHLIEAVQTLAALAERADRDAIEEMTLDEAELTAVGTGTAENEP